MSNALYDTSVGVNEFFLYVKTNVLTFTTPHMRRTEINTVIMRFIAVMIFTETKI